MIKPILAALALATLCVAVRVPWAGGVGLRGDMLFFQRWATTAAELRTTGAGIGKIYAHRKDCNYPPVYLIILSYLPAFDAWWHGNEGWKIARVTETGRRYVSPHHRTRNDLSSVAWVLKLPAMVADVAITLLVLGWTWARTSPTRAVVAGGLWALNPLSVYNSSYFGQVDAIHSLWMLAALLAAVDRRPVLAWILVALALLTKLQSIVITPVVALLTVEPLLAAARRADGAALRRQLRTLLLAAAAAAAVTLLILAPFARAGTLGDVRRVYAEAVSNRAHARVTVSAYNLWWLTLNTPVRFSAIKSDRIRIVGRFTARQIGFALFGGLTTIACVLVLWGGGRRSAMLAAPCIALAFFLVSTQMKARYGFASMVLMAPLISCGYRYALVAVLMSATFLINSASVLRLPSGFFGLADIVNPLKQIAWTGDAVAAVNLAILAYLFFELFRCARAERRGRKADADAVHTGA